MSDTMTRIALLVFISLAQPHVNRFDVLELNQSHDEDGRATITQWIAWDWDHEAGVHRCQWWTRYTGETIHRTPDGWRVTINGKRIEAASFRSTRTVGDPEIADRAVFETGKRRGVK